MNCGHIFNPAQGACPICGGGYLLQPSQELVDALNRLDDEDAIQAAGYYMGYWRGF